MSRRIAVSIDEVVVRGLPRGDAARTVAALRHELARRAGDVPAATPAIEPCIRETLSGASNPERLGARAADAVIRGSTR